MVTFYISWHVLILALPEYARLLVEVCRSWDVPALHYPQATVLFYLFFQIHFDLKQNKSELENSNFSHNAQVHLLFQRRTYTHKTEISLIKPCLHYKIQGTLILIYSLALH